MNPSAPGQSSGMGTLYLVGTPIGNLDDITFRALSVLKSVDYVFCEDTRRTSILLRHFQIVKDQAPRSFHDHSPRNVAGQVRKLLEEGKSIAYVTDGGMPVVSDPGFILVREAHALGVKVVAVPGPSAAVMLFAASGLESPKYLFHGFFPRTRGEVERWMQIVKSLPVVHIFYEAPGRVRNTLEILLRNLDRATPAALGRELTKIHEELVRGTLGDVVEHFADDARIRGECVIAVLGGVEPSPRQTASSETAGSDPGKIVLTEEQQLQVRTLIKSGMSSKDTARELSKKFGIPRRVIYEFIIHSLT